MPQRPPPTQPPPTTAALPGAWQIASTCTWAQPNWQATLNLAEAPDGTLSGSVPTDNLGDAEILPTANGYNNSAPSFVSRMTGSTMTLVIHPKGWESTLQLTGQPSGGGFAGSVHHYGNDDCRFTMTRR